MLFQKHFDPIVDARHKIGGREAVQVSLSFRAMTSDPLVNGNSFCISSRIVKELCHHFSAKNSDDVNLIV